MLRSFVECWVIKLKINTRITNAFSQVTLNPFDGRFNDANEFRKESPMDRLNGEAIAVN